jgi:hypothetical protein
LTGQPVHGLVKYIGPIEHPERMNANPKDFHPSRFGMELYAHAVSEIILQQGIFREKK